MTASNALTSIAVFCGASQGFDTGHAVAARALGKTIAEREMRLVYGGSDRGLMGEIADSALAHDGEVIGVIPSALVHHEIAHNGLTELRVVDSMHDRKLEMAAAADGFIAMAGGFGTLDESFEALTWTQLGIHQKPLGFLNVDGYFDLLLQFMDQQVAAGFVKAAHREMIVHANNVDDLIDAMQRQHIPNTGKWVKP
ncbi:MAG: TIGR00730 family Rossman fold protein [Woeseiaceae bacterium]